MTKLVLKLAVPDDRHMTKVMRIASGFAGTASISYNGQKMTVTGQMDPIKLVKRLRKSYHTEIISVGPANEKDDNKIKDHNLTSGSQVHIDSQLKFTI